MRIFLVFSFLLACAPKCLTAQLFPKEGGQLCYRLVGFSFPAEAGATQYKIEIATGAYAAPGDFEKHIVSTLLCKKNRSIVELPSFGTHYTWRTTSIINGKVKTKGVLRHFDTRMTADVDTNVTRLRVIHKAEKYKDAYVFVDGARALYDMNGKPVWFLPGTDLKVNERAYPRDLKPTPQGSLTFLTKGDAYEITYGGYVLWHTNVGNQNVKRFHHEFTRLSNGHYMGMLSELSDNYFIKLHAFKDSVAHNFRDSARYYQKAWINSIVEYDQKGNLAWRWDGFGYLKKSDLYAEMNADSLFDINDLHENAFFFNEKNKTVYLSLRNVSRVIKIRYPQGDVLNTYGTEYRPGVSDMRNDLFCGQHSCRVSEKGNLYLFNNNPCGQTHIPTVAMFEEPIPGKGELKKIWEYSCTVEDKNVLPVDNPNFVSGGNVLELQDGSIFVSMGSPYSKAFIVDQNKQILWSAISEKYNRDNEKWEPFKQLNVYRASIIGRKQLEEMIWKAEKYE